MNDFPSSNLTYNSKNINCGNLEIEYHCLIL